MPSSHSQPPSNTPETAEKSAPVVVLQPVARSEAPVLVNLFELYVYDFSEFMPLELKASGRFEIPLSDGWWNEPHHHPFFIRSEDKLVGFALARRGSRVTGASDIMDMAEFFVLRGVRKKNIGSAAAHALLRAIPGRWEIRVRQSNAASRFWSRVAESWPGSHEASTFETADGARWNLLRIEP
jgi:predicted acetyltransferase